MDHRGRYAFDDCVLDATERQLWKGGRRVALAPKAHDLLVALVRRAGRLVMKADLLDEVWPDAFVEEGILAVHVSALRKALGDSNKLPRCIETVSRSGYRFIAEVRRVDVDRDRRFDRPLRPHAVYEHVGRGRLHLLSAAMRELPLAEAEFSGAIALDASYPEAHAGLAMTCCAEAELRVAAPREAYAKAMAAALRALALDDTSAEAQVALGTVLFLSEWDWTGAERSLARAIDLDPRSVEARLMYGRLLEAIGQLDAGLEMKTRALEEEPLSPRVHLQIAHAYWHQRRYADAIEWARKTLAIDPRHLLAREFLAGSYWALGDFDRHMAENLEHAALYGIGPEALAPLARAYADGGRPGVVRFSLEQARAGTPIPDVQLALLYGEAGDLDDAFRHLDRALDARDPCLVYLAVAPQFDPLRTDPRFTARLARMGLGAVAA